MLQKVDWKDVAVRNTKECTRCLAVLPLGNFHKNKNTKDGLVQACKTCTLTAKKKHYLANIDRLRERNRLTKRALWAQKSDELKEKRKEYIAKNPHKAKEWGRRGHYKHKYGVSVDWVDEQIKAQDSKCIICNKQRELVLDHNHETGEVRGLICNPCNMIIGVVEKYPEYLKKLDSYLGGEQS